MSLAVARRYKTIGKSFLNCLMPGLSSNPILICIVTLTLPAQRQHNDTSKLLVAKASFDKHASSQGFEVFGVERDASVLSFPDDGSGGVPYIDSFTNLSTGKLGLKCRSGLLEAKLGKYNLGDVKSFKERPPVEQETQPSIKLCGSLVI